MTDTVRKQDTSTEVKSVGARRLEFTLSTGSVDRDNDTINPQGWRLDHYKANPVMLWAHRYDELPIAKAVNIAVQGQRLVATAEFAAHDFAETVFQLYKGGFLRATSVGFRPIKAVENRERGGIDFIEQELLEFSAVPVPANPEALVAASAKGINVAAVRRWFNTEHVLDLRDDETVLEVEGVDDWLTAFHHHRTRHRRSEPYEPVRFDIDPAALRDEMRRALATGFAQVVREATEAELRRRQGRVD